MTSIAQYSDLNTWRSAQHDTESPPLSDRLIRALEAHQAAEAHDLAECRALQERLADPASGLLLDLVAQGEQRHHTLLELLVGQLQNNADDAALPVRPDPATATTVRALIRDQHEGARHLRYLARQAPDLYQGLYATLLETMARDSETHATILRALLRRIEQGHP